MSRRPPLALRPADALCLPVLAHLHARCFADAWPEGVIGRLLALPGAFAWLAAWGAEPVGFALAHVTVDEAEIWSIGVAPDWRGRGIAGALLRATLERAGSAGAASLVLEVDEANAAALALYRRHGFRPVGRREGYYRRAGSTAAALVLRHDCSPPAAAGG
ncbi:MAG: ribosomal-protein-alanine N-acetyltransferase [Alphaproteobacteria bacterium]|nr:ribosomal-protein-alanine N-acetyltransferase [Alphaproteobacteria bacterium]